MGIVRALEHLHPGDRRKKGMGQNDVRGTCVWGGSNSSMLKAKQAAAILRTHSHLEQSLYYKAYIPHEVFARENQPQSNT